MRNLDSCRCWRCTLCPCKVRNNFLVNFWNRIFLLWTHCISVQCISTVYQYSVSVLYISTVYQYCISVQCISTVYQYSVSVQCISTVYKYCISVQWNQRDALFVFNLLRIKGHYVFRALLAHPQEALNKRHLVYCVCVVSVGCTWWKSER
jgi:hypothetical protein